MAGLSGFCDPVMTDSELHCHSEVALITLCGIPNNACPVDEHSCTIKQFSCSWRMGLPKSLETSCTVCFISAGRSLDRFWAYRLKSEQALRRCVCAARHLAKTPACARAVLQATTDHSDPSQPSQLSHFPVTCSAITS